MSTKTKEWFFYFYVDNTLLAGNDLEILEEIRIRLSSIFEMKGMNEARYVLRVRIIRNHSKKLLGSP